VLFGLASGLEINLPFPVDIGSYLKVGRKKSPFLAIVWCNLRSFICKSFTKKMIGTISAIP